MCIQLKCAEWRPYTSYETEEEDEDSKPRPILSMSAGKNYSLKVSRSVYLSNCINVPNYLWNMSTIHIIESYIVLQDLRIKKL